MTVNVLVSLSFPSKHLLTEREFDLENKILMDKNARDVISMEKSTGTQLQDKRKTEHVL